MIYALVMKDLLIASLETKSLLPIPKYHSSAGLYDLIVLPANNMLDVNYEGINKQVGNREEIFCEIFL